MNAEYARYRSYGHGRVISAAHAVPIIPLWIFAAIVGAILGVLL